MRENGGDPWSGRADSGFSPSATATASTLSIHPFPKRTWSAGMLEMWPQSFCARECEESNPSKQPCRLARPDYVYSGAVSFSLHMNLFILRTCHWRKKTLFINDAAPTTRSPITLRLASPKYWPCDWLFASSGSRAIMVVQYISFWLYETEWIVARPPRGRGSRGEGECVLLRPLRSKMSESTL